MTSTDPPQLTVRSTADLISAVPYLLGFHPVESLVLLAMRGTRIVFVARGDLPEPGKPAELRQAAEYLAAVISRQGVDAVTIIGYGPPNRVTPAVDEMEAMAQRAGLMIFDALRVTDGRYWSYRCDEPRCCPPEGIPFDPATSAVAAAATFAGHVALPDRAALTGQVAPVDGSARESMGRATKRAEERLVALLAAARIDRPVGRTGGPGGRSGGGTTGRGSAPGPGPVGRRRGRLAQRAPGPPAGTRPRLGADRRGRLAGGTLDRRVASGRARVGGGTGWAARLRGLANRERRTGLGGGGAGAGRRSRVFDGATDGGCAQRRTGPILAGRLAAGAAPIHPIAARETPAGAGPVPGAPERASRPRGPRTYRRDWRPSRRDAG